MTVTLSPAPGDDDQEHAEVVMSGGPDTYFCDPPASMPQTRPIRGFGIYAGRHVKRSHTHRAADDGGEMGDGR